MYGPNIHLWDLETGVMLKEMEGHCRFVMALAVSQDGQIIASGDDGGEIITWHGETGEILSQPIKAHSDCTNTGICGTSSLDFSPDGAVLATGGWDGRVKFWCTKTWQMQGEPIECSGDVYCVQYSPSGELLAIATDDVQIYNPGTRELVASLEGSNPSLSLAWTPDGTRLLTGGGFLDCTIQEWDPLTWQRVSFPWEGHTSTIKAIAIHPAGALVASVSDDKHVRLWRLSDRQTIAIFKHSSNPIYVTFSADGKGILSEGDDNKTSEWAVANPKASLHP
jgi:WD40 repeat protein